MKIKKLILLTLIGLIFCGQMQAQLKFEKYQKISSTKGNLKTKFAVNEAFGYRMSNIGDLDGDGVPDIAVAAPGDSDGGPARGAIFILFMKSDGTVKSSQKISYSSGNLGISLIDNERFGHSVSTIGDLDGDGVQDLVVGAVGHNNFIGGAYILFMKKDGTVKSHTVIDGNTTNFSYSTAYLFGHDVVSPGDIDGDGVQDIAIGSIMDNDGGNSLGAVYVIFMKKDGSVKGFQTISQTQGNLSINLSVDGYFGYSLGKIGDANGDGVPDLIVGAPDFAVGTNPMGAVFILYLKADGTVKSHKQIDYSSKNFQNVLQQSEAFGTSVQMMDDANGDGIKELLVGAEHYNLNTNDKGTVYVLYLDSSQEIKSYDRIGASTIKALDSSVEASSLYGISVIALPNFNSNYTHTIAVGAIHDSDGNVDAGALYVISFKGHTTGVNESIVKPSLSYLVYPNPATDLLTIDFGQNTEIKTVAILDLTGKIMDCKELNDAKDFINLSHYSRGIYFVRISDNYNVYIEKIVKE